MIDLGEAGAGVVKEVLNGGRGALKRVFGGALVTLGEMIDDRMKVWRFGNLVKLRDKVERIAAERDLPEDLFKALPFGDAMRTIDAASQEDEDDVQEMWARLIVKAASEAEEPSVKKLWIEVLKALSPADTALLELLPRGLAGRQFNSAQEIQQFNQEINAKAEGKWRTFSEGERAVSIQNLVRLRCIAPTPQPLNAGNLLKVVRSRELKIDGAVVDPRQMEAVLTAILERIYQVSGALPTKQRASIPLYLKGAFGMQPFGEFSAPELNYLLTPLGESLMDAVTLNEV